MTTVTLSKAARSDLLQILRYSAKEWGADRAVRYVEALHDTFENLAAFPHLGTDVGYLRRGYFRFTSGSHMVYFRKAETGVFIVRILHQSRRPETQI